MATITAYAEIVAEQLRHKCHSHAERELLVWLVIALSRESVVSVAYDDDFSNKQVHRLGDLGVPSAILNTLRGALVSIWAQERAHQAYLRAVLRAIAPPASAVEAISRVCAELRGGMEGLLVGHSLSDNPLAAAIAQAAFELGAKTGIAPSIVREFHADSFVEYCHINRELEFTAVRSYARMLVLLDELGLPDVGTDRIRPGTTLTWDIARIRNDEVYHESVFSLLSRLFAQGAIPNETLVRGELSSAQLSAFSGDNLVSGSAAAALRARSDLLPDHVAISQDPMILVIHGLLSDWT